MLAEARPLDRFSFPSVGLTAMFSVPDFNLELDAWYGTRVPGSGAPDITEIPAQLYITSRGQAEVTAENRRILVLPIYVRIPLTNILSWRQANVVEIPAQTGRYYIARWKTHVHEGFPNEYLLIMCEQCDQAGSPIARDVPTPAPGPPPTNAILLEGATQTDFILLEKESL